MVDFTLSEHDRKIIEEIKREGLAARKYARYYEDHEFELTPEKFPEADEFKGLMKLMGERAKDDTPAAVFGMLMAIYRSWGGSVSLREGRGGLGNAALQAAGTDEQKAKWGKYRLAMSITEPGAGSDTKAIRTTAVLDGDEWVLNGDKIFVTTGIRAEGVVVWATIDPTRGRAGIKSFLVMKGTPGFEVVRQEKKLGIRTSDTAAYHFEDCRIPRENLLGGDESVPKEGSGSFRGVMRTFNITRPGVAAGGIGNAQAAFDFTVEELAKRGAGVDWDLGEHNRSAVQQKLIEIEADIEAATLTVLRAAWLAGEGAPNNTEASVAKSKGGEISRTVPQRCLDLLGPLGITQDYLVEKWFRDARITDIYEGTGQIQRLIIARAILDYSSEDLN